MGLGGSIRYNNDKESVYAGTDETEGKKNVAFNKET